MNIFEELVNEHGSKVVWKDDDQYVFALNDELADEWKVFEGCNGEFAVAYGDDIPNAYLTTDLSKITKELEEFLRTYVGPNCYTHEQDYYN